MECSDILPLVGHIKVEAVVGSQFSTRESLQASHTSYILQKT